MVGYYPGGYKPWDEDMLHKEIRLAKEGGFNMIRFLGSATIPPYQDMADEMGLFIYEEHPGSWCLAGTPESAVRHETELLEVIKRDRNHPSVAMWGILNEVMIFVPEGPVTDGAINMLPAIRKVDPTRFVALDSGRFNYARWHKDMFLTRPDIGNYSLPRTTEWMDDVADVHQYGEYPTSEKYRELLRDPPVGDRKVFLTEFGFNNCLDLVRDVLTFQQMGIPEENDEYGARKVLAERLERDWESLKMDEVFPTTSHLWDADRNAHCHKVRVLLALVQSSEKLVATSYTGFVDEGGSSEGAVGDYFRRPKPALTAVREMQEPLMWCLFADPVSLYRNAGLSVEAVLRNEDVLVAGSYKAEILLFGPGGIVWRREGDAVIPAPPEGKSETGFVVHPVFKEEVKMDLAPGEYELHVRLLEGGDARASLAINLGDPDALGEVKRTISAIGLSENHTAWLNAHGIEVVPFDEEKLDVPLILHRLWKDPEGPARVQQALSFAEAGGRVYFLEVTGSDYPLDMDKDVSGPMHPAALSDQWQKQQQDLLQMLPGMEKAQLVWDARNWVTGTSHYVRPNAIFDGLPTRCVIDDKPIYSNVYPMHCVAGYEGWEEIAGAFSTGSLPAGGTEHEGLPPYYVYWHATDYARRKHGKGQLVYCTYQLLEHTGTDPAADRMLHNLLKSM